MAKLLRMKKNQKPGKCGAMRCKREAVGYFDGVGYLCVDHEKLKDTVQEPAAKTEPEWKQEVVAAAGEYTEARELVLAFEIEGDGDLAFVSEELQQVKKAWKALEDKRKAITKPMNAALREVNALFKPALGALKDIEDLWKSKLLEARRAAQQKQEELLREAATQEEPQTIRATLVAASESTVEAESVSFRDNWVHEVHDIDALPREFMVPDHDAIRKVVKAMKDKTKIPGVRAWNEPIASVRSSA